MSMLSWSGVKNTSRNTFCARTSVFTLSEENLVSLTISVQKKSVKTVFGAESCDIIWRWSQTENFP